MYIYIYVCACICIFNFMLKTLSIIFSAGKRKVRMPY